MAEADRMRDRLRELGRTSRRPVSAELEARVAERVRAEGPAVMRRSRQLRTFLTAGAVALPVALCAGWLAWRNIGEPREDRAAPIPAPLEVARRAECASRSVSATDLGSLSDGRRGIDLGERGRVVLEPGAEAKLDTSNPCKLDLQLAAGRVSVHAARLFGGELKVSAGSADVVVHGTLFAVERNGGHLAVDVADGVVSVARAGRSLAAPLQAGQSLQFSETHAPVVLALSSESRHRLEATLSVARVETAGDQSAAAPVPSSARPSLEASPKLTTKLLNRADQSWQSGARDEARARYREAGEASGPTAEAAWLALARRELSVGNAAAARDALASYAARFPSGVLAVEAVSIEFRAALLERNFARAVRLARVMIERYPNTAQSEAAARWRRARGARR